MSGYTKLFSTIITSSVWSEDDKVRIMWVTMLASADAHGYVSGSVPGMAAVARMSIEDARRSIEVLCSPDPDSRTKDQEGRRLLPCDGGWLVVNYAKYREQRDPERRRQQTREAVRRHRERKRQEHECKPNVSQSKPQKAQAEAEAEAKKKKDHLRRVFDHWNSYTGRSAEKLDDEGHPKRILWHSHEPGPDDTIPDEIETAIRRALAKHTTDEVCSAINNYARVLLGAEFKWTHVWSLTEFLTRGEEPNKQAPRKWFRFLPGNFIEDRYLSDAGRTRRENPIHGPQPLDVVKQQLASERRTPDVAKTA